MNKRIDTAQDGWVDTHDNLACNSASQPHPVNILSLVSTPARTRREKDRKKELLFFCVWLDVLE
jgi:hypothetical protein